MIRTRLYAGLLAAVLAVPAQAQLIGVGVGTLVPQGDLADHQKSGLAVSGNVEFGGRLKLRAELLWTNSDLKGVIITDPSGVPLPDDANVSGTVKYIAGLGSAVFYFGTGVFQPYVLGGGGYYSRSGAQDVKEAGQAVQHASLNDSDFGLHFGAGLKLKFGGLAAFGELRYHRVKNEGDVKTNFVPILIGVRLF